MSNNSIPIFISYIKAGFPSPAEDFIDQRLNLNDYLIEHPEATFFVKVSGDSMINAGIHTGDILIVDRSLLPHNNDVVVAILDGDFTVKRFKKVGSRVLLVPENSRYSIIEIDPDADFLVWGVVKHVIHSL